jgi:hypothetical protein
MMRRLGASEKAEKKPMLAAIIEQRSSENLLMAVRTMAIKDGLRGTA